MQGFWKSQSHAGQFTHPDHIAIPTICMLDSWGSLFSTFAPLFCTTIWIDFFLYAFIISALQHPFLMNYIAILFKLPIANYSELNNTNEISLTNPLISSADHYLYSILLYRPFFDNQDTTCSLLYHNMNLRLLDVQIRCKKNCNIKIRYQT